MRKKSFYTFLIVAVAFLAFPLSADAQLGGLLKKVKKGVESVTKATGVSADVKAAGTEVAIPSGGTMINPFAEAMDVELVGCYGKSTSENYGTAYLVLKVKMKLNKTSVLLSGNENGNKTMAVDADGNAYQTSAMGGTRRDVTEGIFVKVKIDDPQQQFADVKKSVKEFQLVKLSVYIDPQHRGAITFKNVPVLWDVEPE